MNNFLETLSVNQLKLWKKAISIEILSRAPPVKRFFRISIDNIPDMTDDYEDTRIDIIEAMGDVRSKKVHVNLNEHSAVVTFDTPELATAARQLLAQKYKEVRVF